jgi:hypothetical protein
MGRGGAYRPVIRELDQSRIKEDRSVAQGKAKTAEKSGEVNAKHFCPSCAAESRVMQFAGVGRKGFFWVCDKNCGYVERTR